MSASAEIQVSRVALPALEVLEVEWRALELRSSASFFQSWAWIGTWLEALPRNVPRSLLRARLGERTVGLGIACDTRLVRHGVLASRGVFLNCTGRPELDELTIEYNGFLAEIGLERAVAHRAIECLQQQRGWDELYLHGCHQVETLAGIGGSALRTATTTRPCRFVDLEALRRNGRDYAEALPSTPRYNLRRSLRDYRKLGEVRFEVASTPEQAARFLGELEQLHQRAWRAKGAAGAFANRFFRDFHFALVQRRFAEGVVSIARADVAGRAIGCLYNFVHRGHVYHYQSGFDFEIDRKLSPGVVCHALAVAHYLARGERIYDFMAGDTQYKKDLGTDAAPMVWLVLRQPRLKFRVEDWLRACRRRLARGASEARP